MIEEYYVNEDTLLLLPVGKEKTKIFDINGTYCIKKNCFDLVDDSCQYYGSSLEGRTKGTYKMTGLYYKAPIIISEQEPTIFFPTCSPRLKECAWFNVENVERINMLSLYSSDYYLLRTDTYSTMANVLLRQGDKKTSGKYMQEALDAAKNGNLDKDTIDNLDNFLESI